MKGFDSFESFICPPSPQNETPRSNCERYPVCQRVCTSYAARWCGYEVQLMPLIEPLGDFILRLRDKSFAAV